MDNLAFMKRWNLIVLLFLIVATSACKAPVAPDFKDIKDLKVNLAGLNTAHISGEALFYNPNNTTITIKNIAMDVAIDGDKVTSIDKEFNIKAGGMKDFSVPIDLDISLKDLHINSISSALNMLNGGEKQMHITGKIKVKAYGINFKVPIDHTEPLRFKL